MRARSIGVALCAAGVCSVASLSAQVPRPADVSVAAEIGARAFLKEPGVLDRAKFTEYKATPSGALLQQFLVQWLPADSFKAVQITGRNVGQDDQSIAMRAALPGKLDFRGHWDRIPHTFTTNARSLGNQVGMDLFRLPAPRPDTATWNSTAPYLAPVRTRWDAVTLATTFTPTTSWDVGAEFRNLVKTGQRPFSMAFGSPGNNAREILEPIAHTQRNVRLAPAYGNEHVQLTAAVDWSFFENTYASVAADNPLLAGDTQTGGAATGRTALAPNNSARTEMLNGALNLPLGTRVFASATRSTWQQDAQFIPPTSNSLLINDARLANIPSHLGGEAGTQQLGISSTSRPFPELTFSARYRDFQYRDDTELDSVPARVVNDRSISAGAARERLPFARRNADVSVAWRFRGMPVTVGAGYGYERFVRDPEARNVARQAEKTTRASVDFAPPGWVSLHASVSRGVRRGLDEYMLHDHEAGELQSHRRFDEANRNRTRSIVKLVATPRDQISLGGNFESGRDTYPGSPYGLQSDRSTMAGGDVTWSVTRQLSFDASYTHEAFRTSMRSRYRFPNMLDNLSYDWVANNRDIINTAMAGFTATIVPGRWEVGGDVAVSDASFVLATFNPTTPTGGTAAQNLSATAVDLPEVTQTLVPVSFHLRYVISSDWLATVRIQSERYDQSDFRTLDQRLQEGGGIFLGNDIGNYNAQFVTISLSYRPALLSPSRPGM